MNDLDETGRREDGETGRTDDPGSDVTAVRQLVLLAHPDTVPELVAGETVSALLASIEPARAAYQRVMDSVPVPVAPVAPVLPVAPAGAAPPLVVDPDRLPPGEKIRRGLAARG